MSHEQRTQELLRDFAELMIKKHITEDGSEDLLQKMDNYMKIKTSHTLKEHDQEKITISKPPLIQNFLRPALNSPSLDNINPYSTSRSRSNSQSPLKRDSSLTRIFKKCEERANKTNISRLGCGFFPKLEQIRNEEWKIHEICRKYSNIKTNPAKNVGVLFIEADDKRKFSLDDLEILGDYGLLSCMISLLVSLFVYSLNPISNLLKIKKIFPNKFQYAGDDHKNLVEFYNFLDNFAQDCTSNKPKIELIAQLERTLLTSHSICFTLIKLLKLNLLLFLKKKKQEGANNYSQKYFLIDLLLSHKFTILNQKLAELFEPEDQLYRVMRYLVESVYILVEKPCKLVFIKQNKEEDQAIKNIFILRNKLEEKAFTFFILKIEDQALFLLNFKEEEPSKVIDEVLNRSRETSIERQFNKQTRGSYQDQNRKYNFMQKPSASKPEFYNMISSPDLGYGEGKALEDSKGLSLNSFQKEKFSRRSEKAIFKRNHYERFNKSEDLYQKLELNFELDGLFRDLGMHVQEMGSHTANFSQLLLEKPREEEFDPPLSISSQKNITYDRFFDRPQSAYPSDQKYIKNYVPGFHRSELSRGVRIGRSSSQRKSSNNSSINYNNFTPRKIIYEPTNIDHSRYDGYQPELLRSNPGFGQQAYSRGSPIRIRGRYENYGINSNSQRKYVVRYNKPSNYHQ